MSAPTGECTCGRRLYHGQTECWWCRAENVPLPSWESSPTAWTPPAFVPGRPSLPCSAADPTTADGRCSLSAPFGGRCWRHKTTARRTA